MFIMLLPKKQDDYSQFISQKNLMAFHIVYYNLHCQEKKKIFLIIKIWHILQGVVKKRVSYKPNSQALYYEWMNLL